MATDLSSRGSIIDWAQALKQRICDQVGSHGSEADPIQVDSLRNDLLEAVEFLIGEESRGRSPPNGGDLTAEALAERIADLLDASLADWQASISDQFARTAAQELNGQLRIAERLNSDLREQESRLARQMSECQDQQAAILRQQAKLVRQRKSVAKSLRARKAQMLLDVERLRGEILLNARQQLEVQIRAEVDSDVEEIEKTLAEQRQRVSQLEQQLNETPGESPANAEQGKVELKKTELETGAIGQAEELARVEQELQGALELLDQERAYFQAELEAAHRSPQQEQESCRGNTEYEEQIGELQQQLTITRKELEDFSETREKLCAAELDADDLRIRCSKLEESGNVILEAEDSVEQLSHANQAFESEIEKLQFELELAKEELAEHDAAGAVPEAVDEVQQRLADALEELEDLKNQNADLASQLAKRQINDSGSRPHVQFDQESLSWEERKALIIRQLEHEAGDDSCDDHDAHSDRLEIERILATTQRELEKRDREIAELRSIVEHQADTKQGVAIGAAAIAQMLDSDDLVAQERKKLKDIQQEWEDKLRQAEIDLSMERAKLARERTHLELELENVKLMQGSEGEQKPQGKTRKWLEHLGLRDENKKS